MFGYNILGFGGGGVAGTFAATGGTVTGVGDNILHSFTSSGDFVVTGGDTASVDYLVIAGGGSGGGKATSGHFLRRRWCWRL